MSKINDVNFIVDEINEKTRELNQMMEGWSSDDPEAAAESDPGLQYELEEYIERLWRDLKVIVNANDSI